MPNSNIAVPHFEQSGRLTELECTVAEDLRQEGVESLKVVKVDRLEFQL